MAGFQSRIPDTEITRSFPYDLRIMAISTIYSTKFTIRVIMIAQMGFITSRAHFTNGSILLKYWQKETEPNQSPRS